MARVNRNQRKALASSLSRDRRGVVYVEFLIAFIPLFILVLGICQLSFVASAKAVVEHAAWAATRSAIVVLEADPKEYGEIPRGYHLRVTGAPIADITDVMSALQLATVEKAKFNGAHLDLRGYEPLKNLKDLPGYVSQIKEFTKHLSSRMTKIRAAAYVPLLPLASTSATELDPSIRSAIHNDFFDRMKEALTYTRAAAAISLHTSRDDEVEATEPIAYDAEITARIVYLYSCDVPIARQIMCHSLSWLRKNEPKTAALEHAENSADLATLLPQNGRYALLVGKATLLNQGAAYEH